MHKSQDGCACGSYIAHPHNHGAWFAKRVDGRQRRGKLDREISTQVKTEPPSGPPKKEVKDLKLALNQKLATAMVTQHGLTSSVSKKLNFQSKVTR